MDIFVLIIILNIMSVLSQAFKAGKLFVWETNGRPQLMNLPEKIFKASIGTDHVVAIG